MSRPSFSAEPRPFVADASVWINLVASGYLDEVLDAVGMRAFIPSIAIRELERGRIKGHDTSARIADLVATGRVTPMSLTVADESVFYSLVSGTTAGTLDDGEAATLAIAIRLGAVAVIDERKATTLGIERFPDLHMRSTTDLLFATLPDEGDGKGPLADALFSALRGARMRVPPHHLARVAAVLGPDRASSCPSLPAAVRDPSGGGPTIASVSASPPR